MIVANVHINLVVFLEESDTKHQFEKPLRKCSQEEVESVVIDRVWADPGAFLEKASWDTDISRK